VCCSKSSAETLSLTPDFSDPLVIDGHNSNDYESKVQEKLDNSLHGGEMSLYLDTDQVALSTDLADIPLMSPIDNQSRDIENAMALLKIRELKSF